MFSTCTPILLFCSLLALALPAQDGGAPGDAAAKRTLPNGLVVGVVDLAKAFDVYPRTIEERKRLTALNKAFVDQLKEMEGRRDELKNAIPLLKEGSRERNQKLLELELSQQRLRAQAQLFEDEMQAETMRMQLAIYHDLETAVQQLAKDKGVHVVLRIDSEDKEDAADVEKASSKELVARLRAFESRQVLFAAAELDLTSALIKRIQVPVEPTKENPPAAPQGNGKDGK